MRASNMEIQFKMIWLGFNNINRVNSDSKSFRFNNFVIVIKFNRTYFGFDRIKQFNEAMIRASRHYLPLSMELRVYNLFGVRVRRFKVSEQAMNASFLLYVSPTVS